MGCLDSFLALVQIPAGFPVGTLAVGRSGAINAAIMAASILALSDPTISRNLEKFRADQTASVIEGPQAWLNLATHIYL